MTVRIEKINPRDTRKEKLTNIDDWIWKETHSKISPVSGWKNDTIIDRNKKIWRWRCFGGNVNLKSQQDMQIEISGKLFQDVGLHLRQLGESM